MKYLLLYGINLESKDAEGETAWQLAERIGNNNAAGYLSAVAQLRGCYAILTAINVTRIAKLSWLKLLTVDHIKLLRDFLVGAVDHKNLRE